MYAASTRQACSLQFFPDGYDWGDPEPVLLSSSAPGQVPELCAATSGTEPWQGPEPHQSPAEHAVFFSTTVHGLRVCRTQSVLCLSLAWPVPGRVNPGQHWMADFQGLQAEGQSPAGWRRKLELAARQVQHHIQEPAQRSTRRADAAHPGRRCPGPAVSGAGPRSSVASSCTPAMLQQRSPAPAWWNLEPTQAAHLLPGCHCPVSPEI